MNKVCVVGAGASGLMAALYAAKEGARVTVFEGNQEAGKKILKTGNGKCNFTNSDMSASKYISDSSDFVQNALLRYSKEDLTSYLTQLGLLIKEKNGYFYPYNDQASAVRDVLLAECNSYEINIRTGCYINMIAKNDEDGSFLVSIEGQKGREQFDKVILSTGTSAGLSSKERENGEALLKPYNISFDTFRPALSKMECRGLDFENIKGVRSECLTSLFIDEEPVKEEFGEILFWEKGVSGICIFNLSNYCSKELSEGKEVLIKLDLLPEFDEKDILELVRTMFYLNQDKPVKSFLKGLINDKIAELLINLCGYSPDESIFDIGLESIENNIINLKNLFLQTINLCEFKNCQALLGGVLTSELTENFELKSVPGLFVTGELINVTGICGGYNLQWAFTSGALAGAGACY